MRAIFLSDVHVSPEEPAKTASLLAFLDGVAAARWDRVFILGDLFHYWVGRGNEALEPYRDVVARIAALRSGGAEVVLVHGNRDFHMGPEVGGALVAPEGATLALGGRLVRVAHGDLLCRRDTRYQAMRRVIRSAAARRGFLALPLRARLGVGSAFRAGSKREVWRKATRKPDTFAIVPGAVRRLFAGDVEVAVVGHVHRARRITLEVRGRPRTLYTLGAWDDGNRSWLECRDGVFTLYDGPAGEERVLAEGSSR